MPLDIDKDDLRHGVLGLVIAVVEIIRDTLRIQAFKRMDSGSLTDEECERLGEALLDLDVAIEEKGVVVPGAVVDDNVAPHARPAFEPDRIGALPVIHAKVSADRGLPDEGDSVVPTAVADADVSREPRPAAQAH